MVVTGPWPGSGNMSGVSSCSEGRGVGGSCTGRVVEEESVPVGDSGVADLPGAIWLRKIAEAIAVCGLRGRAVGQSTRRGAALGGGRVGHILFLLLRLAQEQESQHDRCKSNTHQRTPKADRK